MPEDRLFAARLSDMAERSGRTGSCVYSHFFDEGQCAAAERQLPHELPPGILYRLWGGFPEARRKMLAVYPDYLEESVQEEYPMTCLTFTYRKEDSLTHRDFLGSFMGAQLKRETIGDIVAGEGRAQALVTDTAASLLLSSVTKIGRTGVKITDTQPFDMEVRQEFRLISGTVASVRLDSLTALAANISREKAAGLIRSEKVEVNHLPAASVSMELNEGDILSIRGFGRFIFSGSGSETRRGRIHVELKKYI
ncbi:MAG: RNA-binding protein [Ruminococcus sp.]|nr:RNA-binding protein [Ruminococcus sp.]